MFLHHATANHWLPNGNVHLLGAVDCVTGATTRIECGGAALVVDCGIAQGAEAHRWQLPAGILDADALLLTHGHLDHVGAIPIALEAGFRAPILGTPATLAIADLVITDSIRLGGGSDTDVNRFRRRFHELCRGIDYERGVSVEGFEGSIHFREAGHILGSSSVEVVTPDTRVICSGDLGRPDSPILRDYNESWDRGQPVDLVVMESTYGDREHAHGHDDIEAELERILKRSLHGGGHVLIPSFAIGRTQTLLYHLNSLVESKRIPHVLVAVDTPMGLRVTELYQRSRNLFDAEALGRLARGDDPLEFHDLYAVRRGSDSVRLHDVKEPMIIIAGSGMCTGGRIVAHLKDLLPRESTTVLFAGYQAQGTPGAAIQRSRGGTVRLDGEDVAVRAKIETLIGLSAHADRRELMRWLRAVPDVQRVALHHGEVTAQRGLAEFAKGRCEHETPEAIAAE